MKAVSLFSGCGGDTLGLERAGFEVVAFSEFNKASIATHLQNFPNSEHIVDPTSKSSDITKISNEVFQKYKNTIDIIFAGFPCFVKDTLVLTENGYKEIQDVSLQDKLLTHKGRFRSIVNKQIKNYENVIYDIKVKYHPNIITSTQEHPFYVRTKLRTWNNVKKKYDISFGSPEWKEANKLTMDDYFGMHVNINSIIPEFTIPIVKNTNRTDTIIKKLDNKDEWFMMGYFIGDGWIEETLKNTGQQSHKIRFSVNVKDIDTVLSRIQKVLPITDKQCDTGKCKKFGCADVFWWNVLKGFGKYAHGKYIPEWVQDAPNELVQEFITGYMAADGNTYPDGYHKITTVSYNLAFGLQRLYLKLGYLFSISKTIRSKTCIIEGRTVNQRDTYDVEGYLTKPRYTSFIENDYVWYAPSRINRRETSEVVYNFEVEEDNSYCVENIIVHNCQGFSRAGKKNKEDPRNQMFHQFVRATSQIKPRFIIGENVTGLVSMKSGPNEDDPLMLDIIRQSFRQIGYDLTYKVLEGVDYGVPQKRKRILIVGWDTVRVVFDPAAFWASVATFGAAKTLPVQRSFVKASLNGALLLTPNLVPDGFTTYALPVPNDAVVEGTPHPFVTLKANERLLSCSKRDSPIHSEIINLDAPSKTIICTYDHQPRLLVGLRKPNGHSYVRTLHPDELKQIQGFPADFILTGNVKEQITQIGNAVPPALVESVSSILKTFL
jgi:DNA (cytosine-5)-methyltransferase 1